MIVEKKLNNNAVFALDDNECKIVVGKGGGFHYRLGVSIDTKDVEKIYVSSDTVSLKAMGNIIEYLSIEELRLGEEILEIINCYR